MVNILNFKFSRDADVCDEDRVGNSLLQIWKLRFGQKAFGQTLSTLVNILKLNLGQYSEARFCQDFAGV